ncbi:hypothetical protein QUF49_13570 [Fictibacillus sp. b24]|nr:hypothetical protein [Fictibacillus sp. b24]MDM5317030.1 hypothetical protein [Fictibacillus sp. b24]
MTNKPLLRDRLAGETLKSETYGCAHRLLSESLVLEVKLKIP